VNIVICGGGTAGWISAFIIEDAQPGIHDITVVESSAIGIVGAGEGSTGLLIDVLTGIYFNRADNSILERFMKATDATYKFGIKHVNWGKDANSSYFAPLDTSVGAKYMPDPVFNYVLSELGNDKVYLSSQIGQVIEKNKLPRTNFGFHFDAFKVGKFFKEELKDRKNIRSVDAVIKDVNISENGDIESLLLDSGAVLEGEFFIDCTGFARVLMKKLDVQWKSYKENLPVNSAMPFLLDYENEDIKKDIIPATVAQAMSSGWMWKIPLSTRMGCGYVYDDNFITPEQAQAEVEQVLGHKITPIRHIKFEAGRCEVLWKKNCIATGLAGAFLEPLEATSIHSTAVQMLSFTLEFLNKDKAKTVTEHNINSYNRQVADVYESYKEFIVLHYQGGRKDTPFWRYINEGSTITDYVKEVVSRCEYKVPTSLQYQDTMFKSYWGGVSPQLWNWILAGLGILKAEVAKEELIISNSYNEGKFIYEDLVRHYNSIEFDKNTFSIFDHTHEL